MPAPAMASTRRAVELPVALESFAEPPTPSDTNGEDLSAWRPLSEQSLLAALATLATAT